MSTSKTHTPKGGNGNNQSGTGVGGGVGQTVIITDNFTQNNYYYFNRPDVREEVKAKKEKPPWWKGLKKLFLTILVFLLKNIDAS